MPLGATFVLDNDEFGQTRIRYAPAPYTSYYRQGDMNEYNLSKNMENPQMLKEDRYEYDQNLLNVRPNALLHDMTQETEEYFFNDPESAFLRQPIGDPNPPRSMPQKRKSNEQGLGQGSKRARSNPVEDQRAMRRAKVRQDTARASNRSRGNLQPFSYSSPLGKRKKMASAVLQ